MKRLDLNHSLISDWFELPDYEPLDTDFEIQWGPKFNFNIMYDKIREWKRDFGLEEIFEVFELYCEPRSDFDNDFKSKNQLIARFKDLDSKLLWKLFYEKES